MFRIDIRIEPQMQPLSGEVIEVGSNVDDAARLHIAAKGFWSKGEMPK